MKCRFAVAQGSACHTITLSSTPRERATRLRSRQRVNLLGRKHHRMAGKRPAGANLGPRVPLSQGVQDGGTALEILDVGHYKRGPGGSRKRVGRHSTYSRPRGSREPPEPATSGSRPGADRAMVAQRRIESTARTGMRPGLGGARPVRGEDAARRGAAAALRGAWGRSCKSVRLHVPRHGTGSNNKMLVCI